MFVADALSLGKRLYTFLFVYMLGMTRGDDQKLINLVKEDGKL